MLYNKLDYSREEKNLYKYVNLRISQLMKSIIVKSFYLCIANI